MRLTEHGFPAVGIPGTIDNDIAGTDYTIGFDTAVNTAVEAIDKLRDTSSSHGRTFVVEVMGRNAGDIALWAGIASGADQIIVPEEEFDIEKVASTIQYDFEHKGKNHHIIVLAEGVMSGEAFAQKLKEAGDKSDLRVTNLGHILRGVHQLLVTVSLLLGWVHMLLSYLKKAKVVWLLVFTMKNLLKAQSLVLQKKVLCSA